MRNRNSDYNDLFAASFLLQRLMSEICKPKTVDSNTSGFLDRLGQYNDVLKNAATDLRDGLEPQILSAEYINSLSGLMADIYYRAEPYGINDILPTIQRANDILCRLGEYKTKTASGGKAGANDLLTDTEQNSGKIKLTDFIRHYCQNPLNINSKASRIHTFVKDGKIDYMPKPVNSVKGNETKLYKINDLKNVWGKLQDTIKSLPNLKD